jgi:HEAT repeat protein
MWATNRLPALLLLTSLCVAPASAQRTDAVEELRRALEANSPDDERALDERFLQQRERLLLGQINALRSPWDLSRALFLDEWKITSRNAGLRAQEVSLRGAVGRRFLDSVRGQLRDPATFAGVRLALANLLDEIGPRVRALSASEDCAGLTGAFAVELVRLLEDADPEVRMAACRALGKIQGNPAAAAAALAGVLQHGRSLPDKLAALDGLTHLLRSADTPADEADPHTLRIRLAQAARLVLAAGGLGVRDAHPEVRRRGLEVVRQAVQSVSQALAEGESDLACWRPVFQEIHQLGEALARALADPRPEVRGAGRRAVHEVAFLGRRVAFLADGAEGLRQTAARTPAESSLDRKYLAEATRPAVGVLVRGLADPEPRNRLTAVESLELLGDAAGPAAPALLRALADPDRFVRWAAVRSLGKIPALPPSPAVERMTPLLLDTDTGVRVAAAAALERFGPGAQSAVPTLLRALVQGSDREAQVALMHALVPIAGARPHAAVPTLCQLLRSPDPCVRRAALTTLGEFGPAAGAALPNLRAALGDEDQTVREAARVAVAAVTPGAGR